MLTSLGPALTTTSGPGSLAVEEVYTRARELCQQVEEPRQLFPVLWGLWRVSNYREELQRAGELGQQLLTLAHQVQDRALLLEAHHALWPTLFYLGELAAARGHLAQGMALYDPQQHRAHAFLYGGHDPGLCCQSYTALTLWALGYPDQALQSSDKALTLARELAYPASLAGALNSAAVLHQFRRERQAVQEAAEAFMALATEQGNAQQLARGMILRGWALTMPRRELSGVHRPWSCHAPLITASPPEPHPWTRSSCVLPVLSSMAGTGPARTHAAPSLCARVGLGLPPCSA
jgi:predicted ATPase